MSATRGKVNLAGVTAGIPFENTGMLCGQDVVTRYYSTKGYGRDVSQD